LDDDDDDDPVLASIRERRLEQLRAAQRLQNRNESRGHGEVRTISQDDFLPECLETTSRFVAVHFFHRQFERCRILDHHLRIVASRHVECKFVRIDAERAPFFARKLSIRTLPTLVVFEKGQVLDRLIGFDGLESPTSDPDRWKTSQLQVWLGRAGAIEYDPLLLRDDDDEDSGGDDDDDNNDANPMGLSRGIRRVQSRHRISED
jgi:thiol-disulfide isomerase/thioredoxin